MIEGGTPTITLRVVSPPATLLLGVVDTGFKGGVSVPTGTFAKWGMTTEGEGSVMLANGSELICPFAVLTIEWFDEAKEIGAYELGDEVLVGMELLDGTRLELQSPSLLISPL